MECSHHETLEAERKFSWMVLVLPVEEILNTQRPHGVPDNQLTISHYLPLYQQAGRIAGK